jgi:thiosulfate/3-mercaptopyruvate sulfurtransferase
MYRVVKKIFLPIVVLHTVLYSSEEIFLPAKNVLNLIDKEDVQFILAEESKTEIRKSQVLNVKELSHPNILGKMPCAPFYLCTEELSAYLKNRGLPSNKKLVIYDNSYGIYSSTLYAILESLGQKKMTILNGGVESVALLDPNQKIYTKYAYQLAELRGEDVSEKGKNLEEKLAIIEHHLLTQRALKSVKLKEDNSWVEPLFNNRYLLTKDELKEAVKEVRQSKKSKITIIDACPLVDIVGSKSGNYLAGVTALSWSRLIDVEHKMLKSDDILEKIFKRAGLKKENSNYVYCMSANQKAIYLMMALRQVGFKKVRAFTGDWNTWIGERDESK